MDYHNHLMKIAQYWERKIKAHYLAHRVDIKIIGCHIIPDLRRFIYTVKPKKGEKLSDIENKAESIQVALGLHLFYVYRDGIKIKIAVSEHDVKENKLLKILRSPSFANSDMELPLALGYDIMGGMYIADLAKLHHLLIAGPTGSGKSVALKCLILSLIVNRPVTDVRLIVFEIGSGSLSQFSEVLHLYHHIVKDVETGVSVLESLVAEMDCRYALGEEACKSLEYLVCIIDEFDDTIANIDDNEDSKRFTKALNSLIRRGRKAKIILVLASHDPTVKTTKINVNLIDSRIVFTVLKHQNSSTSGVSGADKLPGGGAMIFRTRGAVEHLQGSLVENEEIDKILSTKPVYHGDLEMLKLIEPEITPFLVTDNEAVKRGIATEKENKELAQIIIWVLGREDVSALKIKEAFKGVFGISDKPSKKIIDRLCALKIVTEKNYNQPRLVIPKCFEDLPEEVVIFLNRYEYSEAQIKEVFKLRREC